MRLMLDACWRAAMYCLRPRVILWSLLPLVLSAGAAFGLSYFYWEPAVDGVRALLESWSMVGTFLSWLDGIGWSRLREAIGPLIVVVLALPLIVILSLLLVAALTTTAMVRLVEERRFPGLERRHGASLLHSIAWSLGCTVLALLVLVASIPLWLIPPLVLVLPPLIWGWLTYRIMAFDALAEHADAEERGTLLTQHRWQFLAMGVISGYLGAAPSLVMIGGAFMLVLAPVLVIAAVWIYTLVFAFSTLWFVHYALAALERLREQRSRAAAAAAVPPETPLSAAELAALDSTRPAVRPLSLPPAT